MIFADLIDAMVADFAALPALAAVNVCDGAPTTNDLGAYLFVGVGNPDTTSGTGASGVQSWPTLGFCERDDEGDLFLAAYADTGDADQKAARDAAVAVMEAVQDRVRAAPTLSVPHVMSLSFSDYSYRPMQGTDGAAVLLFFRIRYTARL